MDEFFWWIVLIGFIAQLIDGALGMAYGLTSTSLLITLGLPLHRQVQLSTPPRLQPPLFPVQPTILHAMSIGAWSVNWHLPVQ